MARLSREHVPENGQSVITFDTSRFPFKEIVTDCVRDYLQSVSGESRTFSDLSALHDFIAPAEIAGVSEAIYALFLHKKFSDPYDELCGQIVRSKFGDKASYQRVPSIRIQMPGQISVNYHTDEWYGHGYDVQNFWLPLVPVSNSNSMFVADEATSQETTRLIREGRRSIAEMNDLARSACSALNMNFGQIFCFNSHVIHGTELNTTTTTRVSFDFRMLRDGDDRGLKDESFFLRPGGRARDDTSRAPADGIVYIGKNVGFTALISQKYQALLCNRYGIEKQISTRLAETELSGFPHHPVLWNMISGTYAGSFAHIVMFSALLLPHQKFERHRVVNEAKARGLTLHFVAEDVVVEPSQRMHDLVEAAYQRSRDLQ